MQVPAPAPQHPYVRPVEAQRLYHDEKHFPLYSGTDDLSPRSFLDRYLLIHPNYPEQQLCQMFPQYLKGEAASVYRALPLATRNNWPALSQAFLQYFDGNVFTSIRQASFSKLKQKPGEGILSFSSRCREMAQEAFSHQGPEERNRQACRAFLTGVDPRIKPWLPIQDVLNLNSLTHAGLEVENRGLTELNLGQGANRIGGGAFGDGPPQARRVGTGDPSHPITEGGLPSPQSPDPIHALTKQLECMVKAVSFRGQNRRARGMRSSRNQGRNNGFSAMSERSNPDACYCCGKMGHFQRDCTFRLSQQQGQRRGSAQQGPFNPQGQRGAFRAKGNSKGGTPRFAPKGNMGPAYGRQYGEGSYQTNVVTEFPACKVGVASESECSAHSEATGDSSVSVRSAQSLEIAQIEADTELDSQSQWIGAWQEMCQMADHGGSHRLTKDWVLASTRFFTPSPPIGETWAWESCAPRMGMYGESQGAYDSLFWRAPQSHSRVLIAGIGRGPAYFRGREPLLPSGPPMGEVSDGDEEVDDGPDDRAYAKGNFKPWNGPEHEPWGPGPRSEPRGRADSWLHKKASDGTPLKAADMMPSREAPRAAKRALRSGSADSICCDGKERDSSKVLASAGVKSRPTFRTPSPKPSSGRSGPVTPGSSCSGGRVGTPKSASRGHPLTRHLQRINERIQQLEAGARRALTAEAEARVRDQAKDAEIIKLQERCDDLAAECATIGDLQERCGGSEESCTSLQNQLENVLNDTNMTRMSVDSVRVDLSSLQGGIKLLKADVEFVGAEAKLLRSVAARTLICARQCPCITRDTQRRLCFTASNAKMPLESQTLARVLASPVPSPAPEAALQPEEGHAAWQGAGAGAGQEQEEAPAVWPGGEQAPAAWPGGEEPPPPDNVPGPRHESLSPGMEEGPGNWELDMDVADMADGPPIDWDSLEIPEASGDDLDQMLGRFSIGSIEDELSDSLLNWSPSFARFRTPRISWLFTISLVMMLLPGLSAQGSGRYTGYDCSQLAPAQFFQVPKDVNCEIDDDMATRHLVRNGQVTVFGVKSELPSTEVHGCTVSSSKQCTYMNFFGSSYILSVQHTFHAISAEACRNISKYHLWKGIPLKPDPTQMHFSSQVPLVPQYSGAGIFCCQEYCSSVDNIQVTKGTVMMLSDGTVRSSLAQFHHVNNTGSAYIEDSVYTWNKTGLLTCRHERKGVYKASIACRQVILESLRMALTLNITYPVDDICFPSHTFASLHSGLFLTIPPGLLYCGNGSFLSKEEHVQIQAHRSFMQSPISDEWTNPEGNDPGQRLANHKPPASMSDWAREGAAEMGSGKVRGAKGPEGPPGDALGRSGATGPLAPPPPTTPAPASAATRTSTPPSTLPPSSLPFPPVTPTGRESDSSGGPTSTTPSPARKTAVHHVLGSLAKILMPGLPVAGRRRRRRRSAPSRWGRRSAPRRWRRFIKPKPFNDNPSINFIERKLTDLEYSSFSILFSQICDIAESQLLRTANLLHFIPSVIAREMYGFPVIAKYSSFGRILEVRKCKPVTLTSVDFERTKDTCSVLVPAVTEGNRKVYLDPSTGQIYAESEQLPKCGAAPEVHWANKEWMRKGKRIHVTPIVSALFVSGKFKIPDVDSAVYHYRNASQINTLMDFLNPDGDSTKTLLKNQLSRLRNATHQTYVHPGFLESIVTGIAGALEHIWDFLETPLKYFGILCVSLVLGYVLIRYVLFLLLKFGWRQAWAAWRRRRQSREQHIPLQFRAVPGSDPEEGDGDDEEDSDGRPGGRGGGGGGRPPPRPPPPPPPAPAPSGASSATPGPSSSGTSPGAGPSAGASLSLNPNGGTARYFSPTFHKRAIIGAGLSAHIVSRLVFSYFYILITMAHRLWTIRFREWLLVPAARGGFIRSQVREWAACALTDESPKKPFQCSLIILVNSTPLQGLWDTGAIISLARLDAVERAGLKGSILPLANQVVRGVDGSRIPIMGQVTLNFSLGPSLSYEHSFRVVEKLSDQLILGLDFLSREEVNPHLVDLNKRFIQIGKTRITVGQLHCSCCFPTIVDEQVTLQPRSVFPIKVMLWKPSRIPGEETQQVCRLGCNSPCTGCDCAATGSCTGVHSAHARPAPFSDSPVCISNLQVPVVFSGAMLGEVWLPPCVVIPDENGQAFVPAVNPSSAPISVFPAQKVGHSEALDESQMAVLSGQIKRTPKPACTNHSECDKSHLDRVFINPDLTTSQQSQIRGLLDEYSHVFASHTWDIGFSPHMYAEIKLNDQTPIYTRQYPFSHGENELIDKFVQELLHHGIIKPCISPFNSPILLVPKRDTTEMRSVVNYSRICQNTVRRPYPLPRLDDVLNSLHGKSIFSSVDILKSFHHIPLTKSSQRFTAFTNRHNQYCFQRLPLGHQSGSSELCRSLDFALQGLLHTFISTYIDDILIYSSTFEQHLSHLRQLFERMRLYGFKLSPKKCRFGVPECKFLGFIVSGKGIRPDKSFVQSIQNMPVPRTVKDVRKFMGMVKFLIRFCPRLSIVSAPLNKLTGKFHRFFWDDECQVAFETCKSLISSAPTLAFPNWNDHFVVACDASDLGVGGVLLQHTRQGDRSSPLQPVAYSSRLFTGAERKYPIGSKELLSIYYAVVSFRPYLFRHKAFAIINDHKSLSRLWDLTSLSDRMLRIREKLRCYDFQLYWAPGSQMVIADLLSRSFPFKSLEKYDQSQPSPTQLGTVASFTEGVAESHTALFPPLDPSVFCFGSVTREEWKRCHDSDPQIQGILARMKTDPDTALLYRMADGGVLEKRCFSRTQGSKFLPVCPTQLRPQVLSLFHVSTPYGGHTGSSKTLSKIRARTTWPHVTQEVVDFIKACPVCNASKPRNRKTHMPLFPIDTGGRKFDIVFIDLLGPFPQTPAGNKYLLVVVDSFSKHVEPIPLPDMTANTVILQFCIHWVSRFGPPLEIHSDQGSQFISKEWSSLMDKLGIVVKFGTTYLHTSQGQVERMNRTLLQIMRSTEASNHMAWDQAVLLGMLPWRMSTDPSTGFSSSFLLFQQQLNCPFDRLFRHINSSTIIDYPSAVEKFCLIMHCSTRMVLENIQAAQSRQKSNHDKEIHVPIRIGGLCRMRMDVPTSKLQKPYPYGPYRVVDIEAPHALLASLSRPSETRWVSMAKLVATTESVPMVFRRTEPVGDTFPTGRRPAIHSLTTPSAPDAAAPAAAGQVPQRRSQRIADRQLQI